MIAVPKTGSTTIQDHLVDMDPAILRNQVRAESGTLVPVATHATASEIKRLMGHRAAGFRFVAFFRDPREVVLSKYHFYRSGRAAREQGILRFFKQQSEPFKPSILARVLAAQMLPLSIWARLYPYKSSAYFIADSRGEPLVDDIGLVSRLQADVDKIFKKFGYSSQDLVVPVLNKTSYDRSKVTDAKLQSILERRLPEDFALFSKILEEYA